MGDQPVPSFKFDRTRLTRNDQITGGATVVLFISLFLPWFGVSIRGFSGGSISALSAHGYLYIVLILCLVVVGYLFVRAGMADVASKVPVGHQLVLLVTTTINAVLILIAFVFKPSGLGIVNVGWRFGSFVGLIAALVAVAPLALPAIQAGRAKR